MNKSRRVARKYLYRQFLTNGLRFFMEKGDFKTANAFSRELERIDQICRKR